MKNLAFPIIFSGLILLLSFSCERADLDMAQTPNTAIDSVQLIRDIIADPQECANCHPNHYEEWRTSMHAYAMTDPVFLRLNEIGQERTNDQLDQFCVKCHAPFAPLLGETPPGFDPGDVSSFTQNAIFCDVCHKMNTENFRVGEGIAAFHLDRTRRGPIEDPKPNSFHDAEFDNSYNFSGICSPCHNVKSPDKTFFIETTNLEWDSSPYSGMGLECQGCHMPTYSGQAAVGGPQRDNLHRHTFVGVDYPLVDFPGKENTIEMVRELLQGAVGMTVNAPAALSVNGLDTIRVTIDNNRTGHDVPSGNIFDRQMWIEVILRDAQTDSVYFSSGRLDANGDLKDHHSELVKNGHIEEDSALTIFNGTPYDENGEETLFFWETHSADRNTIGAFKSHTAEYPIEAPGHATTLELCVRLRFRSFPPYLLREIDLEQFLPDLLIFDMNTHHQTISVSN